jgi:predicted nucleic-acid-binding protein
LIGVDTNILARYILDDDPVWSVRATQFIDNECTPERPGYINLVVLAELVWLLRQAQDFTRDKITVVIQEFMEADNLVVAETALIGRVLEQYKAGKADFADCLIVELNRVAMATPTVTIDKKASLHKGFQHLSRRETHV